jgi:hypothetical protein
MAVFIYDVFHDPVALFQLLIIRIFRINTLHDFSVLFDLIVQIFKEGIRPLFQKNRSEADLQFIELLLSVFNYQNLMRFFI